MPTPDNNYVHNQGDIAVYPGGGSAANILPVGSAKQVMVANPSSSNGLGVDWENVPLAATTGTFTFSAGTHAQIALTSVTAGSVIAYTIKTLGTVTVAQAISTALAAGTGFTPTSASASDTSTVNWALVG
jgi:hypothetical protein